MSESINTPIIHLRKGVGATACNLLLNNEMKASRFPMNVNCLDCLDAIEKMGADEKHETALEQNAKIDYVQSQMRHVYVPNASIQVKDANGQTHWMNYGDFILWLRSQ